MLRYRICAHCGSTIGSPTAFFCYHCGTILEQTTDSHPSVKSPPPIVSISSGFSIRGRVLLFPILIIVLVILGMSVYWLRSNSFRSSNPSVEHPENAVLLQNFHFSAPALSWGKLSLAEIVPDAIDYAVFGRNFADFVSKFIQEGQSINFQKITGLTLAEAQTYLEPDFSFYKSGTNSAYLGKIKARNFVEQKVEEAKKYNELGGILPYIIGDYLLVTDSSVLSQLTADTLEKKHLSLSLLASFSDAWRQLPHRGQFFFFASSHDNLGQLLMTVFGSDVGVKLSEKIQGQALTITSLNSGTLLQGTIYGKSGK